MSNLENQLLELYGKLGGGILLGFILGRALPPDLPVYLGKFLFWIGVPISVVAFMRRADLSGAIWVAPVLAWVAILLAGLCAKLWITIPGKQIENKQTLGSFFLLSMFGNTGYVGYPVILALVGEKYFGWAIFYDLIGSALGAYGLGVAIAARFSTAEKRQWQLALAIFKSPTLWSFGFGVMFREVPLPSSIEQTLQLLAWISLGLSLVLIGMRISQLKSWVNFQLAFISLGIKMFFVPLVLGLVLVGCGFTGPPQLVIILQIAMPPAFATLVLAETYHLDQDLTVTTLAIGSIGLLCTLPIWLWLFGINS